MRGARLGEREGPVHDGLELAGRDEGPDAAHLGGVPHLRAEDLELAVEHVRRSTGAYGVLGRAAGDEAPGAAQALEGLARTSPPTCSKTASAIAPRVSLLTARASSSEGIG